MNVWNVLENWIGRIIGLTWAAFGKLNPWFEVKWTMSIGHTIKNKGLDQEKTYGSETSTLPRASQEKLRVAQRTMGGPMLGISLRDEKWNEWIRRKTEMTDVIHRKKLIGNYIRKSCKIYDWHWTLRLLLGFCSISYASIYIRLPIELPVYEIKQNPNKNPCQSYISKDFLT